MTDPITKPCAYCGEPILQTRNNKAQWEQVLYCDNACKRKANRKAEWTGFDTEPTKVERVNPHTDWRPKRKKNQPKT